MIMCLRYQQYDHRILTPYYYILNEMLTIICLLTLFTFSIPTPFAILTDGSFHCRGEGVTPNDQPSIALQVLAGVVATNMGTCYPNFKIRHRRTLRLCGWYIRYKVFPLHKRVRVVGWFIKQARFSFNYVAQSHVLLS